jgi:hypothetical protein
LWETPIIFEGPQTFTGSYIGFSASILIYPLVYHCPLIIIT